MADINLGKTVVGGGTRPPVNGDRAVDGNLFTYSGRGGFVGGGDSWWRIDYGAAQAVASMRTISREYGFNVNSIDGSSDGSSWTPLAYVRTQNGTGQDWTYTFGATETWRYFRLYHVNTGGYNSPMQLHVWSAEAGVTASPPPPPEPVDVGVYDPSGVFIVRFDNLLEKRVRVELNGAGSGFFVIHRSDPQATAANLARGNIVRVTFPQIDPDPIFEFILEEGDFALISNDEEGGEELRFGGPGSLALLRRAIMDYVALTFPAGPHLDLGQWVWRNAAAGEIFRRVVEEAEARGALGGITRTFTYFTDSDGIDWPDMGHWTSPIGGNLFDEGMRLVAAGQFLVRMDPGFILSAWQQLGVDRHSATFAADKVRFVKGVNVADELGKKMAGGLFKSHVLVHGEGSIYRWRSLPGGTYPYVDEGFIEVSSTDSDVLDAAGDAALGLHGDTQEALIFAHTVPRADQTVDEDEGLYLPGPPWSANGKYWPGDLVTVHTGTGNFDFDETTPRVYAITLYEAEDGSLAEPIVELNAPWADDQEHDQSSLATAAGGGSSSGGSGPHVHAQYQPLAQKDVASGYAGLDASILLSVDEMGASAMIVRREISPAQITANTDNYNPTGLASAEVLRVSTDASRNLTGIAAPASGYRALVLENVGAFDLVLKHDVTSTSANRFYCPDDADVTLQKKSVAILVYDTTVDRWRVVSGGGGASDHGTLTGLGDDDHPQYATNAEFDDHSARHESGGADAIKLDDLAAPDDNTDLNASTSAHGLMKKYPGGSTTFLRADGTFATPSGFGPADHTHENTGGGADGGGSTLKPDELQIPTATGALPTTEGEVGWDSDDDYAKAFDGVQEVGLSHRGWAEWGLPTGFNSNAAFSGTKALAAAGGSMAIPIVVPSHMKAQGVMFRQANTSLLRQIEGRLYVSRLNDSNTLDFVTGTDFTDSVTPSAATTRSADFSGAPVYLAPGKYWLVIRNTHASNTWSLGIDAGAGNFQLGMYQTKTLGSALGSTLDFVAATWLKFLDGPAVALRGRDFGETTGWQ